MTSFHTFDLERWQSAWEHRVRFNLSESGVLAPSLGEFFTLVDRDPAELMAVRLGYAQSDGSDELRAAIAAHYQGVGPDHIVVTVGSSEANFLACWTLLAPGDHVAVMMPNYLQVPGLARNFGCTVSEFWLHADDEWEPDPAEIAQAIRPGTKAVLVTNPHNPTGKILSAPARKAIVDRARDVGAWILADEVFHGSERAGEDTATLWGASDRVVVVNGMSKGWGLPGLRVGWIVAPPELKRAIMQRHDYTVIGAGPAQDWLMRAALGARDRLVGRTRDILNANYPVLEDWLGTRPECTWYPPDAGAITFVRVEHPTPTLQMAVELLEATDVLVVPGDHFGLPGWLRLGYGNRGEDLTEGLARMGAWLDRPGAQAASR